jgi:hypothetical protein
MESKPINIGYSIQSDWLPTRNEIDRIGRMLIQQVKDGNMSASKAVAMLKALAEAIDNALTSLKESALDELQTYPKGQAIIVKGAEFTIKEAGVKYDYASCGDSFLMDMMQEKEELEAKIKDRQKFLRSIKGSEMIVDTRTGELCELKPPTKTSTTTYSIKYPEG